jgi:hypothetical protein
MRMVYIQAQLLALVVYATAAILGALTSQIDLATAGSGKKLVGTGAEVLLSEAAYNKIHFWFRQENWRPNIQP